MAEELRADRAWQHPWLRAERATREIIAERLEHGANEARDRALSAVIVKRQRLMEEGWFN